MVTCTFWNLENSGQRSLELNFKKHAPLYPKCKRNPAIKEEAASLECEPRELGGGRGLRARSLLSLAHSGPFTDMFLDQMFHVLQRSLQYYQGPGFNIVLESHRGNLWLPWATEPLSTDSSSGPQISLLQNRAYTHECLHLQEQLPNI